MLNTLHAAVVREELTPIACWSYVCYDETPLPLRTLSVAQEAEPGLQSIADSCKASERALANKDGFGKDGKVKGTAKVVQTEASLSMLLKDNSTQRMVSLNIPVTCPLQVVDRGTAECLRANLYQQLDIPMWRQFQRLFPMNFSAATADRASANDRCEAAMAAEEAQDRLRLPCAAHIASTAQGRAFGPVDGIISGAIACSLAQQPSQAPQKLRREIAVVLFRSCVVCSDPFPADDAPEMHRFRAVLDMCLPSSQQGLQRRMVLWNCLTGDTATEKVRWHFQADGEQVPDKTKWAWACRVAWALYPSIITVFPRHRWVSSLDSVQAYTLLSLHNVLERAILRWLKVLEGKVPSPVAVAHDVNIGAWQLPEDSESDDGDQAIAHDPKQAPGSRWAEINKQNRGDSKRFVMSKPGNELVVSLATMQLSVKFLHAIERLGSEDWDKVQCHAFQTTGKCSSRMMEANSGRMEKSVLDEAGKLLAEPSRWEALPRQGQTICNSGLAFAMISSTVCCLEQLIWRQWRMYPYKLWSIVETPTRATAQAVLDDSCCLKDAWTESFLKRFPTPEAHGPQTLFADSERQEQTINTDTCTPTITTSPKHAGNNAGCLMMFFMM